MTQATEIKVGEVVAFSSGEYSDYRIGSFAKVLKPLNAEVWETMRVACTVPPEYDPEGDPRFDEYKAVPWLVANGYIEEVTYTELHLGDFNRLPRWENA
jgi:hypothetical protein